MENTEYLEELLRQFNLGKGAAVSEILEKYLEKTLQIKFQRIIITQDTLKEEFVRSHEAFLKIMKIYQAAETKSRDEHVLPGPAGQILLQPGRLRHVQGQLFAGQRKIPGSLQDQQATTSSCSSIWASS